jgi:RNA polymerase sigma-70 factor (TIGR02957 family)
MEIKNRAVETLYRDLRPYAFAVAYRMLGTVSEAEDIVQDAFVRLQETAATTIPTGIASPKAYVTTVVTRLAIDRLRSARTRRELYVGPWLPEPVVGPGVEPNQDAGESGTLTMAVLVLLESLSPVERAVFVLREGFAVDYAEIARIVAKSEIHCRQIATRARQQVEKRRPRFETSAARREALAGQFLLAATTGDLTGLVALLAQDAVFHGDGGGKAKAFPRPIEGRDAVVKLVLGLFAKGQQLGVRCEPYAVNGQPGFLVRDPRGRLINVLSLDVHDDGTVHTVRSIVNPDKLGHLGPLSDLARQG